MTGASKQEPASAPSRDATQASCDEIPAPLPESVLRMTLPPANPSPIVAVAPANTSPDGASKADDGKTDDGASPDGADKADDGAASSTAAKAKSAKTKKKKRKATQQPNNVRKLRQAAMMSKAELARRASVSPLTINRVENGWPCRMDTKRKILEALGLSPSAREEVFGPEPEAS